MNVVSQITRRLCTVLPPSLLLVFVSFPAAAQLSTATVEGTVADAQGGVLRGAVVKVTNTATGISKQQKTDDSGHYTVNALNPGPYQVMVSAPGFSDRTMTGITLAVAADERVDVTLDVGSASETLTVQSSDAPLLDTQTSSNGTVIDNRKVVELPLANRQFYSLALLSPAAYPPAQNSTLGFRGGFNVAGATETSNNFTIDGMWANDASVGAPNFRPSIEDIQEFKLLTGVYPAEFGHNSGGQVVIVSKSGTNKIHGSGYEFIRNQVTDARPYFNSPGAANPAFKQNTFGATVGAPIHRDKTFFFYAYEGQRIRQQITALSTVPTAAMLQGQFAIATQLYDPTTGTPLVKNAQGAYDLTKLPSWSTAAAKIGQQIAAFYPAPNNNNGTAAAPANNYTFSRTRVENMNEDSIRIDHTISSKDTLMGSYNYFNDPAFEPSNSLCGSSTLPGFGCESTVSAQFAVVAWTHTLTPNMINTFSLGYNRTGQIREQEDNSVGTRLLPNAFTDPTVTDDFGVPQTSVTSYTSLGSGTAIPSIRYDNHYQLLDTYAWTRGKHTFKAGVDLLSYRNSFLIVNSGRGTVSFNSSSLRTANNVATSSAQQKLEGTTGYALADLLLGFPYSSGRNPTAPKFNQQANYYEFFVQDDWRATPNFTINYGVRYEYNQPMFDAHNKISSFNISTGTFTLPGQNGASRYLFNPDFNNWAPRVGFSWQPYKNDSTVVKGGFGVSYNPPAYVNAFYTTSTQFPNRSPQSYTAQSYVSGNYMTLDNAFPNNPVLAGSSSTAIGVDPNFRTAYIDQWSLGLQQALSGMSLLEVTYYGSKGTKLPMSIQANQEKPGFVAQQSQRPFPNFANITYQISEASSEYHSLQTKLQQNYSHGISYLVAYTWSKSIDGAPGLGSTSQSSSGTPQNSYNLRAERGLSDFDTRHRLVFSPVVKLPFGKNSSFLTSGPAAAIAGGWQLSGIFQYQSGRPFTINDSASNTSGSYNNADRPNVIADPSAAVDSVTGTPTHTVTEWFNTHAFALQPAGTFGNAGRNIIIGPGLVSVDATVARTFTIKDRVNFQFRLESFNLLNHPNFMNPTGGGAQFGTTTIGQLSQANNGRELQGALRISF